MRLLLRLGFVAALPVFLVVAAQRSAGDDAAASPSELSTSDPHQIVLEALKQYPTPTVEEAQSFAGELEEAMCFPDPDAWEGIDWGTFLGLCFTGIDVDANWRKQIEEGIVDRFKSKNGFFGRVRQSLGKDGTYELVRLHKVDGRRRALFRMANTEAFFNYHDFILIRDAAGRSRAVDIYVYSSGELLSTTMRRTIKQLTVAANRGFFERLFGTQQDSLKNLELLSQMTRLIQQGKPAEALDIYAAAPEEAKQDKLVLIQRYVAAMTLEDVSASFPEIQATVDLFRRNYPQDAALDLIAIGYHVARKEYDQALQAVDRLDHAIGGDAYLHELRGDILYLADDIDKAVKQYELAIAGLPHRDSAYFGLITIALHREDYAAVLAGLKRLDQTMELEWSDLNEAPAYAGFVASTYHAHWLEYLESKDVSR